MAEDFVPVDFAVRYEWCEGSVPPPDHYEYTIRLGPGPQGEVEFLPDYPQHRPPVWRERFSVPRQALARLYALLAQKDVFSREWRPLEDPPVGGSSARLEATAQGVSVSVPGQLHRRDREILEPVYQAIRALVPQVLWDGLFAQREAYAQAHL